MIYTFDNPDYIVEACWGLLVGTQASSSSYLTRGLYLVLFLLLDVLEIIHFFFGSLQNLFYFGLLGNQPVFCFDHFDELA